MEICTQAKVRGQFTVVIDSSAWQIDASGPKTQVLCVKTIRINTRLARCHTSTQGSKGDYNKQHCLLYRAYMESPHAGVTCVAAIPMILSGCCLYTPESAHKSEFTWAWLSAPGRRSTVFVVWQIPVTLSTPWLLVGKYTAARVICTCPGRQEARHNQMTVLYAWYFERVNCIEMPE